MEAKKRKKMDSWWWFSTGYAVAVEISLFLLLKDMFSSSLQVAGIAFVIAMGSLIAMSSLRGNP
jgi:Na+/melibiose symporter-like transporter